MLHIFAFSMLVHAPLISPVRMLKTVVVISTVFDIGCQVHIMATVCAHRRNKLFTVLKCSAMRPKWTNPVSRGPRAWESRVYGASG